MDIDLDLPRDLLILRKVMMGWKRRGGCLIFLMGGEQVQEVVIQSAADAIVHLQDVPAATEAEPDAAEGEPVAD